MAHETLSVRRDEAGTPLAEFLALRLDLSRTKARALLDTRGIFVNQRRVWMARHPLKAGDRVEVRTSRKQGGSERIPILHRDRHLVVADKPPALLTVGKGSLEERLRRQLDLPRLEAVHRLDRDTSGCLLLAVGPEIKQTLVEAFRGHTVEKSYRAIAAGPMEKQQGRIATSLEGRSALTEVRVLKSNRRASYVGLRIATGRTHQIRKHLAGIRHPVLGDRQYFTAPQRDALLREISRQMLHAFAIAIEHPATGERLRVEAPLPDDFRQTLRRLAL